MPWKPKGTTAKFQTTGSFIEGSTIPSKQNNLPSSIYCTYQSALLPSSNFISLLTSLERRNYLRKTTRKRKAIGKYYIIMGTLQKLFYNFRHKNFCLLAKNYWKIVFEVRRWYMRYICKKQTIWIPKAIRFEDIVPLWE